MDMTVTLLLVTLGESESLIHASHVTLIGTFNTASFLNSSYFFFFSNVQRDKPKPLGLLDAQYL